MKLKSEILQALSEQLQELLERNVFSDRHRNQYGVRDLTISVADHDEEALMIEMEVRAYLDRDIDRIQACQISIEYFPSDDTLGELSLKTIHPETMFDPSLPIPVEEILREIRAYMLDAGGAIIDSELLLESDLGKAIYSACLDALQSNVKVVAGVKVKSFTIDQLCFDDDRVSFRTNVEMQVSEQTCLNYSSVIEIEANPDDEAQWEKLVSTCVDVVKQYVFNWRA